MGDLHGQIARLKMTFVIFETTRNFMSIYGYCRISTAKQSIDRQIRNIQAEYPTAHIVQGLYRDFDNAPGVEQAVSDFAGGGYGSF